MSSRRHEMKDRHWERLKGLLPPQKPTTGRPAEDHRKIINGILWKLRTGCPWRDVHERYGPWRTLYSRFYRWKQKGIWDQIFQSVQTKEDAQGKVDWSLHYVDSTTVRAHQHAAGAKKGTRRKKLSVVVEVVIPPRST